MSVSSNGIDFICMDYATAHRAVKIISSSHTNNLRLPSNLWYRMHKIPKLKCLAVVFETRACFLSLAQSKLRLCSANHRPGYWSNLPCDWLSTARDRKQALVLSQEWRCSWSSADRRCSNYIWVINKFIACWGTPYIRSLTVFISAPSPGDQLPR